MKTLLHNVIRVLRFGAFMLFYFKELIVSSTLLAWDIIRLDHTFAHGIVRVNIDLKKDTSIIALANLLSMTPGSLTVDLSADKKSLYLHAMYLENPDKFRKKIKRFETAIKNIFE